MNPEEKLKKEIASLYESTMAYRENATAELDYAQMAAYGNVLSQMFLRWPWLGDWV